MLLPVRYGESRRGENSLLKKTLRCDTLLTVMSFLWCSKEDNNFYFDTDREAHADTVKLFKEIAAGKYEAFTSRFVIDGLNDAPEPKRDKMLRLIGEHDIPILENTDEAVRIANLYID